MSSGTEQSKPQALVCLLKRINCGEDSRVLRQEANHLLMDISPEDIARAEQSLIDDGYPTQIVQLLSATFMLIGIPEEQGNNSKTKLPADHVLAMVMVEHDLMRCFLADLNRVVETIISRDYLSDVSSEFCKLTHIIEHLNAMKEHIEREDNIIFPYLGKYGRISLCQAMQGDHIKIRAAIDNITGLTVSFNTVLFSQFKSSLAAVTGELLKIIQEHLSQEDRILYPIALGIIDDTSVWEEMKAVCDQIGYCGIHV